MTISNNHHDWYAKYFSPPQSPSFIPPFSSEHSVRLSPPSEGPGEVSNPNLPHQFPLQSFSNNRRMCIFREEDGELSWFYLEIFLCRLLIEATVSSWVVGNIRLAQVRQSSPPHHFWLQQGNLYVYIVLVKL